MQFVANIGWLFSIYFEVVFSLSNNSSGTNVSLLSADLVERRQISRSTGAYSFFDFQSSTGTSFIQVYLMKKKTFGFENITVASPCHESWDKMTGDDRARFCNVCERPVYNLSSMTGHEIAELIRENEGKRKCVRFYRREDGTILTQDCPVGYARKRRKAVGWFAAAGAALLGGPMVWKKLNAPEPAVMGIMVQPDHLIMGEVMVENFHEELEVQGDSAPGE